MEFTERGYTLVWSSVTGDTQGVYEGGRRLLTENKAEELYLKKNTIGFRQVTLDPATGFTIVVTGYFIPSVGTL